MAERIGPQQRRLSTGTRPLRQQPPTALAGPLLMGQSGQCASGPPMPWWLNLVVLAGAGLLWGRACTQTDDTWGFFLKLLAVASVLVVLLSGRLLVLELAALGLALWLPSAARCERRDTGL